MMFDSGILRKSGNSMGTLAVSGCGAWIFFLILCAIPTAVVSVPIGCNPSVDLVILVDASESMIVNDPYGKPLYNWLRMKTFLVSVVSELPVSSAQHRVALASYSDGVTEEFLLHQMDSRMRVTDHVTSQLKHVGGNTNTAGALKWTKEYLPGAKRQSSRAVVLIFTDGLSNRDADQTKSRAEQLRSTGAEVFTVSLDDELDLDELGHIASSFQHIIRAPDSNDNVAWQHAINQAVYGICDLPVPTREPPFCDVILDVGLVIDNSGSIRNESTKNENYLLLKEFIKSLLDILDIGPGRTRVGALRFSTTVQTEFRLDTYGADRDLMKSHIDKMQFEGSETNISGALWQARSDIFVGEHGDRPDVQNVAIVIADGESNVDETRTRPEATLLKSGNTRVYVVAVLTKKFDEEELKFIASDPDPDHYFVSPTIRNLPAIKYNLLKHVCQQQDKAE